MKKILGVTSFLIAGLGLVMLVGGLSAIAFTYQSVAQEKITTPEDASIPGAIVRGPWTLKAQADVIRAHTLKSTGGLTFSEMPRQVPKVDEDGEAVLDAKGEPVMVANTARDMWVTATTLTTALHLGILTYAFSGLVAVLGAAFVWIGLVFWALSKKH